MSEWVFTCINIEIDDNYSIQVINYHYYDYQSTEIFRLNDYEEIILGVRGYGVQVCNTPLTVVFLILKGFRWGGGVKCVMQCKECVEVEAT